MLSTHLLVHIYKEYISHRNYPNSVTAFLNDPFICTCTYSLLESVAAVAVVVSSAAFREPYHSEVVAVYCTKAQCTVSLPDYVEWLVC